MRSPRSPTSSQLSAAIGGTLRADTDPLNATNFHTENLFGDFRDAGPRDARRAAALSDAGRHRPARARILPRRPTPRWRTCATSISAYVQTILQDAGYPDPQGAAGRIMDLETKIAKAHETREQSDDFNKGAQVWTAPAARAEGAGHRLGRAARRSAARRARRSSTPTTSPRSRSLPRWSARSRCRTGRTGWPSTR